MKRQTLALLCMGLMMLPVLSVVHAQTDCFGTNTGFVQLGNGYLCLNGSRVRFIGGNGANYLGGYSPFGSLSPSSTTRFNEAGQGGVDLVKVWLDNTQGNPQLAYSTLQSNPTSFFSAMDQMLSDAKNNRILVNPSIVTTHFSSYMTFWSSLGSGDFFTPGSQDNLAFKNNWVKPIVTHYASNPEIAYWEIASEPDNLCCTSDSMQQVIAWASDLSSYVKSLDPNHLTSGDWGGFGQLIWTGSSWDFSLIDQKSQAFDFVSVHSYYCNGGSDTFPNSCSEGSLTPIYTSGQTDGLIVSVTNYYVNLYATHARSLGKAMEFSEYGTNLNSDPTGTWNRMLINATISQNTDSSQVWQWEGSSCGINIVSPVCTPQLVRAMSVASGRISAGSPLLVSDFSVSASSPPAVRSGQSAISTVTVTGLNGFTGTVTLTDNSPSGVVCGSIDPGSVSGSGSATVSCSSSIAGTYLLTISGTNGSLIRTATATFQFQDFGISGIFLVPLDWLLIIIALIGLVSSMALLNIRAQAKLHLARRRHAGNDARNRC